MSNSSHDIKLIQFMDCHHCHKVEGRSMHVQTDLCTCCTIQVYVRSVYMLYYTGVC